MFPDYLPDFSLARIREPLCRGDALRCVHAHVEWRVVAKTETALHIVELRRGDAEIEQDAVDRSDAERREDRRKLAECSVNDRETRIMYLCSRLHRGSIAIDGDEPSGRTQPLENEPAVPSAPERAVDADRVVTHVQSIHCLLQQHGSV